MKFYIPPQLTRLALVFAIFIALFLALRHFLIPDTFGELGHYRAASLIDNAKPDVHYAGQLACFECHQDIEDLKKKDAHKEIHCETCHGSGQKHVLSGEAADIIKPAGREFCGRCHDMNAAKQKSVIHQIDLKSNNVGKSCLECHNPHQPWKKKK